MKLDKYFFIGTLTGNFILLFVLIAIGLTFSYIKNIYSSRFTTEYWFFACNSDDSNRCYKVKLDFGDYYCHDYGPCEEPVPTAIKISNEISLPVNCIVTKKDKWFCREEKFNRTWEIQFGEKVESKR